MKYFIPEMKLEGQCLKWVITDLYQEIKCYLPTENQWYKICNYAAVCDYSIFFTSLTSALQVLPTFLQTKNY